MSFLKIKIFEVYSFISHSISQFLMSSLAWFRSSLLSALLLILCSSILCTLNRVSDSRDTSLHTIPAQVSIFRWMVAMTESLLTSWLMWNSTCDTFLLNAIATYSCQIETFKTSVLGLGLKTTRESVCVRVRVCVCVVLTHFSCGREVKVYRFWTTRYAIVTQTQNQRYL